MILWVNSAGTGWFCPHPCLSADAALLLCPAPTSAPWLLVLACTQAPMCIRDIFYSTEKYTHYLVVTLIISFIYFWLCWVFVAVWAFSSCSEQGWLRFCVWVFHCSGLREATVLELGQALGRVASVVTAPGPLEHRLCNWRVDLVDLRHVGSSWARVRTRVSCIGRRVLYLWATREAVFCNNFKWSIILKNIESLCCTPETNIIL